MAMDRVKFHRLAVLFSNGLIECEKKNADAFTPAF